MERRTFIRSAAWAAPVIAVAVATPLAAASTPYPPRIAVGCTKLPNHGHGGDTGNTWWHVAYDDGTTELLDNGTVMSDKTLKALCRKGGK